MERMIKIDDTLQECVDNAIEQVEELAGEWMKDNPDSGIPDLYNDLDYSGGVHEIVDSCTPIYDSEIDAIFYLHGNLVEAAFDDAGIGEKSNDGWPCGWKAGAIYCYIESQVSEWWRNHSDELEESTD